MSWNEQHKPRAATGAVFHSDISTIRFCDSMNDRQTESRSCIFGGEERIEHAMLMFGLNTGTVVLDGHTDESVVAAG